MGRPIFFLTKRFLAPLLPALGVGKGEGVVVTAVPNQVSPAKPANTPPKMAPTIAPIMPRMIMAGIAAKDHLIMKMTIDPNDILISFTMTSSDIKTLLKRQWQMDLPPTFPKNKSQG